MLFKARVLPPSHAHFHRKHKPLTQILANYTGTQGGRSCNSNTRLDVWSDAKKSSDASNPRAVAAAGPVGSAISDCSDAAFQHMGGAAYKAMDARPLKYAPDNGTENRSVHWPHPYGACCCLQRARGRCSCCQLLRVHVVLLAISQPEPQKHLLAQPADYKPERRQG